MDHVFNVLILASICCVFSKNLHFKEDNDARKKENKQINTYYDIYNQDFNGFDMANVKDNEPNEANMWGLADDPYQYKRNRFARHVDTTEKTLKSILKNIKNRKHKRQKSLLDKMVQRLKKDLNLKRKQIKKKHQNKKSKKHTKTTVKNSTKV